MKYATMKIKHILLIAVFISFFFSCQKKTEEITVISVEEVQDAISKEGDLQLIDVRTLEEYQAGHLKDAKNICVTEDDFQEKVQHLNKNEPVYLYCKSGKRSARAAKILKDMGFTEIYDMDGGFTKWEENQYDFEK